MGRLITQITSRSQPLDRRNTRFTYAKAQICDELPHHE